MRENVSERFHPGTVSEAAAELMADFRGRFADLAERIDRAIPLCREASVALTDLETSAMWVNKAISRFPQVYGEPARITGRPPTTHAEFVEGMQRVHLGMLKITLDEIAKIDAEDAPDYAARYRLVVQAMHMALLGGLEAGIGYDPKEGDAWPVVYIELPTGQVSWHMPAHGRPWDEHTTAEKYARIREFEPEV